MCNVHSLVSSFNLTYHISQNISAEADVCLWVMVGDYGGHQLGLTAGILRRNLTTTTITVLQAGLYDQSDNAAMIILIEILHWGLPWPHNCTVSTRETNSDRWWEQYQQVTLCLYFETNKQQTLSSSINKVADQMSSRHYWYMDVSLIRGCFVLK